VKGKTVSENGRVAISIGANERPYRAVVVEGEAKVVEKDKWELLRKISTKYGRGEGESWLEYSKKEPDRVAVVVKPKRLLSWHYGRGDYRKQNEGLSMKTTLDKTR
jgi:nitroimidazol reductase NimA-like FMN-containing flavoprotein (pyridoxamine 5'-phosphate oxidase superfamily)